MSDWRYVTYLKTGVSHEKKNTECQDRVKIAENERSIIAALSDGVGSCEFSADAAEITTSTACEFFEKLNAGDDADLARIINMLLFAINKKITDFSESTGKPLESLHCTFVFAYINKETNRAIVGRLGDSGVCVIKSSDSFALVDTGDSANMTHSVMSPDAINLIEVHEYDLNDKEIEGFILCSDGLDGVIYTKGERLINKTAEPYFNALLSNTPENVLESHIQEITKDEETPYDDDISIAVISRAKTDLSFAEDPTWLCSCGFRNALSESYCVGCDADFIRVYQKVDFEKFGGKSEFFVMINKKPDLEREFVGLPPIPIYDDEEEDMKNTKSNHKGTLALVIVSAFLFISLVFNYIIVAMLSGDLISIKEELEEIREEISPSEDSGLIDSDNSDSNDDESDDDSYTSGVVDASDADDDANTSTETDKEPDEDADKEPDKETDKDTDKEPDDVIKDNPDEDNDPDSEKTTEENEDKKKTN